MKKRHTQSKAAASAAATITAFVIWLGCPPQASARQWASDGSGNSTTTGSVGIGPGSAPPAARLDVRQPIGTNGVNMFRLTSGGSSDNDVGQVLFRHTRAGAVTWNTAAIRWETSTGLDGSLSFHTAEDGTNAVTEKMRIDGFGGVSIGTRLLPGTRSRLTVFDTAQNAARITLSGQEFYMPSNSSTDGPALLLGVNRPNNKQLWIGDSAALAQNGTNAVLRVLVISGTVGVDAVGTDGLTPKPLSVGNSAGVTMSGGLDVSGTITGGNIQAKYQDVAEWVPSTQKLSAGTVVVLDPERANQVVSSTEAYDTRVAGVVSAQPGIALGQGGEGKVLVATTGRVRVRVDATRSPVRIGDLLVTGDVPGVAMKSEPVIVGGRRMHAPGTIIGKALEPLEKGVGEILVLLSLQ
jgi:hypothetical protein